jgi:hypothetical protein
MKRSTIKSSLKTTTWKVTWVNLSSSRSESWDWNNSIKKKLTQLWIKLNSQLTWCWDMKFKKNNKKIKTTRVNPDLHAKRIIWVMRHG